MKIAKVTIQILINLSPSYILDHYYFRIEIPLSDTKILPSFQMSYNVKPLGQGLMYPFCPSIFNFCPLFPPNKLQRKSWFNNMLFAFF